MGNVLLFLTRSGIIDLGAFCVELWQFFVSERISVPMSYITCLDVCAKNSPGHRPKGVLDPVTGFFYWFFIPVSLINGAGWGRLCPEMPPPGDPWRPPRLLWTPKARFLIDASRPKAASKNQRFFEFSKIHQNGRINWPLGAQGRILDQKTGFVAFHFAIDFSTFFEKAESVK